MSSNNVISLLNFVIVSKSRIVIGNLFHNKLHRAINTYNALAFVFYNKQCKCVESVDWVMDHGRVGG